MEDCQSECGHSTDATALCYRCWERRKNKRFSEHCKIWSKLAQHLLQAKVVTQPHHAQCSAIDHYFVGVLYINVLYQLTYHQQE